MRKLIRPNVLIPFSLLVTIVITTGFYFQFERPPMLSVMASKMNVLYIGVDNPIEISAAGVAPDELNATISGSGGTLEKTAGYGKYLVRAKVPGTVIISVTQKHDTVITNLGSFKFRVKRTPDPIVTVGNHMRDDSVYAKELMKEPGIFTRMVNYDFDCGFKTTGFSLSVYHDSSWKDMVAHGPVFTPEMKQQLALLEKGDRVIISNVSVKMTVPVADSVSHRINGLSLFVK